MAKKQIDGDGLDIPNRIKALPVKRTGPIVAAVIVALLAAMLLQGLITNPRFEWNVVWKYLFNENVLEGIKYTLLLTVISMGIAIILAVILAVMRKSINPVLRGVSWFYIWFFRGTPVYTQLVFWGLFAVLVPRIGVGIPFTSIEFWSIDSQSVVTAFNAAWLGLALNEAAYLAEIVRAGLEAVDPGQTEAAKALGMKRSMIMRRVVLPQAMRIIIPPTGNEFIGMLKTTSLVNAVPFTLELQFATTAIATRLYKPARPRSSRCCLRIPHGSRHHGWPMWPRSGCRPRDVRQARRRILGRPHRRAPTPRRRSDGFCPRPDRDESPAGCAERCLPHRPRSHARLSDESNSCRNQYRQRLPTSLLPPSTLRFPLRNGIRPDRTHV